MTIRLTPDEQGRFGFNVKGGLDLDMPILVSRVAPNTPADRCYPKLNEGDQASHYLLFIRLVIVRQRDSIYLFILSLSFRFCI